MKRILATVAISTVALLGLSACAGPSAPTSPAGTSEESKAPATSESKPSTESLTAACTAMSASVQEAALELAGIDMSQLTTNPQLAVDGYNSLAKGFQDIVAQTSNPELKAAASAVLTDVEAVRDGLAALVGGNNSDPSGLLKSITSLQASFQALLKICQ